MNYWDNFVGNKPNKRVGDLAVEIKMVQAKRNLQKILHKQNQKAKIKNINKEVQRMVFG